MNLRPLPKRSRRLRPLGVALLVLTLFTTACSDSGDAGEAITSNQPIPTGTAVTLGATATPIPPVSTDTGTTTITTDPDTTTVTTDTADTAVATAVVPPTAVEATILADAAFTASSKITTAGLDEVFFGMTPETAAQAASTSWVGLPETGSWPTCVVVTPSNGPDGVSFWVKNGTMERVNVSHPSIRTRSGFGVGTPLTDLQNGIGANLTVTDFADGTQTAEFTPSDPGDAAFRIIFDLSGGEVFRFRSGRVGVVDLPEGSCS